MGRIKMDLKYLDTFHAIVSEGGFSKAAQKLNYTQSTITFHMGQLEKELGVQLFEKAGRNMVLTKAGEQFLPYAEEVLASVRKLEHFQCDVEECQGTLRIGAPETLLCFRLPALFKAFHGRAPRVQLRLQSMNSRKVCEALREDTLDIGIFYENQRGHLDSIDVYPFESYALHLYASPRVRLMYPDFSAKGQDMTQLARIVQPRPGAVRERFDRYIREKSIQIGNSIEIRSTQTIINLAKNDVGVCFLPDFVVREDVRRGELCPLKAEEMSADIHAVYGCHKNKWRSAAIRLFLSLLEEKRQIE